MLKNPLLAKALQGVEAGAKDPAMHRKAVEAGTQVMYAKETFHRLTENIDPDGNLAEQAVGAVMLILVGLHEKSRGTLKPEVMLTAGMAMVLDALDFLEQAGLMEVEKSTLEEATSAFMNMMLPKVGMTPQKMTELLGSVKGTISDPARMAQYQQSMGGQNGTA